MNIHIVGEFSSFMFNLITCEEGIAPFCCLVSICITLFFFYHEVYVLTPLLDASNCG